MAEVCRATSLLITTIDQAINRLLKQNVFVNEPVRTTDFSLSQSQDAATSEPLETEVLIATTTINRVSGLMNQCSSGKFAEGDFRRILFLEAMS